METSRRFIKVKFRGQCAETLREILPGERALWDPLSKKLYKATSRNACLELGKSRKYWGQGK